MAVLLVWEQLQFVGARVLIPRHQARLGQNLRQGSVGMRAAVRSGRLRTLDLAGGPSPLNARSIGSIMRLLGQIGSLLQGVMFIQALPLVEAALIYLVDLARLSLPERVVVHVRVDRRPGSELRRWLLEDVASAVEFNDICRLVSKVVNLAKHVILLLVELPCNGHSALASLNYITGGSTGVASSGARLYPSVGLVDLMDFDLLEVLLVKVLNLVALRLAFQLLRVELVSPLGVLQ